jgi:hypothetical protein
MVQKKEENPKILWRIQKRTMDVASIRYRALLPLLALEDLGILSRLSAGNETASLDEISTLILVKCFGSNDVQLAKLAYERGIPVYFDLCDNIFVNDYGNKSPIKPRDALIECLPYLSGITVPTSALRDAVQRSCGGRVPVDVIPDGIESRDLLVRQAMLLDGKTCAASWKFKLHNFLLRLGFLNNSPTKTHESTRLQRFGLPFKKKILWFGNHGSPWSSFGQSDISLFKTALETIAAEEEVGLIVVSNNKEKYTNEIKKIKIPSYYLEWDRYLIHDVLSQVDVVIAPLSQDDFSICKSSNRSVLALASGVPVVATATRDLNELGPVAWIDDPTVGLRAYLNDPNLAKAHVKNAQKIIRSRLSAKVIGSLWQHKLQNRIHTKP